jgi:hypothetical protein
MTTLPCFVGDADPLPVRVPGTDLHNYRTFWLLTHGETRETKRVRLFTEFISRRHAAYGQRTLIEFEPWGSVIDPPHRIRRGRTLMRNG